MKIKEIKHGNIVILRPDGSVDMRSSTHLERKVVELLDGGTRWLVMDFRSIEHLTSAGIRVLVMAAKRLDAIDGGLVLCSLNEHVQSVFEVSGLTGYFRMVCSREEAIAELDSEPVGKPSRLASLVMKLLGDESRQLKPERTPTNDKRNPSLSFEVAELLSRPRSPRSPASSSRNKTRQDGTSSGSSERGKTKS